MCQKHFHWESSYCNLQMIDRTSFPFPCIQLANNYKLGSDYKSAGSISEVLHRPRADFGVRVFISTHCYYSNISNFRITEQIKSTHIFYVKCSHTLSIVIEGIVIMRLQFYNVSLIVSRTQAIKQKGQKRYPWWNSFNI